MHWSDWVMVNTGFLSHQIGWMHWPLIVMWRWYWSKNIKYVHYEQRRNCRDEMMLYWVRLKCLLKSWWNQKCWFTHSSRLHVENYSSLCCSYSPTVFGTSWCPLIRRPLIHSGVTLRNENPLVYRCFVVWWIQAQGKLGVYCKTGKIYSSICFTGLLTSLPAFSESICHAFALFLNLVTSACLCFFFASVRVAHLQPPGPSEWKPAWHVSHFSPVTPARHAHLPSASHCRLTEPERDSRWIERAEQEGRRTKRRQKRTISRRLNTSEALECR